MTMIISFIPLYSVDIKNLWGKEGNSMKKIFSKVKSVFTSKYGAILVAVLSCAAFSASAFAVEDGSAVTTALTTAFQGVASTITSNVLAVLPIALGIVALVFGVKYVVRFFKGIAKG